MMPRPASVLRRLAALCLALAVLLAIAGPAWACPGCKDALSANDHEGGNLVAGYFWSILFMMSMPFLLVGSFCGSMYLSVRRARARAAAEQAASSQAAEPQPIATAESSSRELIQA